MQLISKKHGDSQVVTVDAARIDAAIAIRFKDRMRAETFGGPDRIILDLGKVDFIDSSGLGAIIAVMKALAERQRLDLAALEPAVDKVFRLTRMDTIFRIFDSVEDALAHPVH